METAQQQPDGARTRPAVAAAAPAFKPFAQHGRRSAVGAKPFQQVVTEVLVEARHPNLRGLFIEVLHIATNNPNSQAAHDSLQSCAI